MRLLFQPFFYCFLFSQIFTYEFVCFFTLVNFCFLGVLVFQNLWSLEAILNQYIFMKKQNILVEKEKVMMTQEKNRIQMLLQDMQNAVNNFNARSPLSNAATVITNSTVIPPIENSNRNLSGKCTVSIVINELKYSYRYFFFSILSSFYL